MVPIEVVATTLPFWSVERMALGRLENHVVPRVVKVLEALSAVSKPEKVEDACEMRPAWKVWSWVQVLATERDTPALEVRQTPLTA